MSRKYWLLKTEPEEFSWQRLVDEGVGHWDGVRNYAARNYLRQMALGDLVFVYHTGKSREVVGVARVVREHYPDATAPDKDFSSVDVAPVVTLNRPVALHQIKSDAALSGMVLATTPRLSVQPVLSAEFQHVLCLAETALPLSIK